MEARIERPATLSGAVAIVVLLSGIFAVPTPPQPSDAIGVIRSYYVEHAAAVRWYVFASALSAALLVVFVSALAASVSRVRAGRGIAAATTLSAGVLTLAATLAGIACFGTLASGTAATGEPGLVRALFDLGNMSYNVGDFMLALVVGIPAVVSLRAELLPKWLGMSGVAISLAWAVASVSMLVLDGPFAGPNGKYGLSVTIAFAAWVIAASIALFLRSQPEPVTEDTGNARKPSSARSGQRVATARPR